MGDGHVVRVVDGRIDSLADHAQLPPCGVEGVVNLTPGRVVGHLVTDENANAHVRLTSYRPYVAKAFFNIASEWNVSLRLAVAPAWPAEPVAIIQQDRLRIDTRKWMAARLAPKKYGERISHDIKGPGPNFQPAILITVDGLTHGYEATREAAMAAFAKSWRRESRWKQPASCLLEREDCTLAAWYRSVYAPRTGGAYDSHHPTAGIAGRIWRRGGRVAACGACAAYAGHWVSQRLPSGFVRTAYS